MTDQLLVWLMVSGAVAMASVATVLGISPWRILGLAGIGTAAEVLLAMQVAGARCGASDSGYGLFDVVIASSLTLYGAAALGGVADGIRRGRAGDQDAVIARCIGCPLASAAGVAVVFFAALAAVAHCLD